VSAPDLSERELLAALMRESTQRSPYWRSPYKFEHEPRHVSLDARICMQNEDRRRRKPGKKAMAAHA
jgi:hypothetical protein